jgi:hypothetical protein
MLRAHPALRFGGTLPPGCRSSFSEREPAMIVQDIVADSAPAVLDSEAPEPLISLGGQSCDELKAIASRGAHGGDLYFAAVKELERRAHDSEVALEAQQTTVVERGREITLTVAILFAAIVVGGIARLLGY